ncbi:FeoA family protein [Alkaliphilus metalliredigens QYMF]|uniref:FeoA family protein n=1 Tax=Alkaliphilus metalliredigens (strain QYMF) TaxID=293826 RepID=A6TLU8_ALKMQ|nr:FeoA family protein [Alkaliphilus metalliredigens]ABR47166.1 FeoA family protein [Alkaliphilus metalliredigens QYMF]
MSLYNYHIKQQCVVEQLPAIGLLKSLGMRVGLTVSIVSKQPWGGPVIVQVGKRSIAIGKDVAEQIVVKGVA